LPDVLTAFNCFIQIGHPRGNCRANCWPIKKAADKARISGEAHFLQGHYYFELKRLYNNVPFIDEKMTIYEAEKVRQTRKLHISTKTQRRWHSANGSGPTKTKSIPMKNHVFPTLLFGIFAHFAAH
jgi:hypothetical protein